EAHTSETQLLPERPYAAFGLKKKNQLCPPGSESTADEKEEPPKATNDMSAGIFVVKYVTTTSEKYREDQGISTKESNH
ncbi:hypothetical protein, partial [Methylobacterium radiotolerans]|uniref:hypothetical protein n=1 Tax=Methylobacterium radiotolerans TaxID=31998 RepID=UPI001AECA07B